MENISDSTLILGIVIFALVSMFALGLLVTRERNRHPVDKLCPQCFTLNNYLVDGVGVCQSCVEEELEKKNLPYINE